MCASGAAKPRGNDFANRAEEGSSEARAYFESMRRAAREGARRVGGFIDYYLYVAKRALRLRFAGSSLVPHTLPALAHLLTEPTLNPDLTVYLCDSASTGAAMPMPTWDVTDQTVRGGVPGSYNEGRLHTSYRQWAHVLSMLDAELREAVFWTAGARQLHFSMRGAPLRDILHWWLEGHGGQMVHGAAVGTPEGGVMLTGIGSSGKSTTALVCLGAGLLYAGDDHVAVDSELVPFVHSLYNSAQLDVGSRYAFSELLPWIGEEPEATNDVKIALFVHERWPDRIVRGFPLEAIVLPRVTGGQDSSLRGASAGEILVALAPATIMALPGTGQDALRQMADLVRRIPTYVLELGTDLGQIPRLVLGLIP